MHGMSTTDRGGVRLGEAKVLDLALLNQLLDRARYLFNRHIRVRAVLIEEINGIDPQALERCLGNPLDLLPAIE